MHFAGKVSGNPIDKGKERSLFINATHKVIIDDNHNVPVMQTGRREVWRPKYIEGKTLVGYHTNIAWYDVLNSKET